MNTKYLKVLEKFFNDELNDAEKAEFEKSLTIDPGLNAAYREYLQILEALRDKESLDLRQKLNEIREESIRSGRGQRFLEQGNNWIWLAALLIVVICITFVASQLIETRRLKAEYSSIAKTEVITGFSELDKELVKFGMRNENFVLELPVDLPILNNHTQLCFEWREDSSSLLILDIINGSGKIIFSTKKGVTSPYCIRKKIPGGFYVFRFRNQTQAFYQGVIYLR